MGYYRMRIKHIKENRIYNHRLYYYWMSISDMERDPNIVKKNLDVIDFVKESMHT